MDEQQTLPPGDVAQDPNVGAPSAVAQSADATQSSAPPASNDAGISPSAASSPAESLTFEQRVEQRFLQVESFLMKLPHSIAHAFSLGSAEPEELAKRAISHLLDHNQ